MLFIYFLLFFPGIILSAGQSSFRPDPHFFSTLQESPIALVDGCINPITGDYLAFETIVVQGAEPLEFHLRYLSVSGRESGIFKGWCANEHLFALGARGAQEAGSSKVIKEMRISLMGKDGMPYEYICQKKGNCRNANEDFFFGIDQSAFLRNLVEYGYTNMAEKFATRHDTVRVVRSGKSFTIKSASGRVRRYKRIPHASTKIDDKAPWVYRLEEERVPNGNRIFYRYRSIYSTQLIEIEATDPASEWVLTWIRFHFTDDANGALQIETSDGQKITYHSQDIGEQAKRLHSMSRGEGHLEKCIYHPGTTLLHERLSPEGVPRKIHYFRGEGINRQKVHSLQEVRGGKTCVKYTFSYYPANYGKLGGYTEVVDAAGNKTIYRYDSLLRLEAIEYYYLEMEAQCLSHKDLFLWGEDPSFSLQKLAREMHLSSMEKKALEQRPKLHYLLARSRVDAEGNCLKSMRYFYDARGNVRETRVYGDIRGNSPPIYLQDGLPTGSDLEYRATIRNYTNDGRNLLAFEKRGDLETHYFYEPDSSRIQCKIEKTQTHFRRTFYQRDRRGQLKKIIYDDGNTPNIEDMNGVTERQMTNYQLRSEGAFPGFVDTAEHWCVDFQTGGSRLLGLTKYTYDISGKVSKKVVCNPAGTPCYEEPKDRLLERTFVGSFATFSGANSDYILSILHKPDALIDPFKQDGWAQEFFEKVSPVEQCSWRACHYNSLDTVQEEVNDLGASTLYTHSRLGQMRTTLHAPIEANDGVVRRPTTIHQFDCNGCLTEEFIGRKLEKKIRYTLDGHPYFLQNADGTKKEMSYDLEGRLVRLVNERGVIQEYTYDGWGRCQEQRTLSPQKTLLKEKRFFYNALHLIKEIDGEGNKIFYEYNAAGRRSAKRVAGKKESYRYDSLGRLTHIFYEDTSLKFHEEYLWNSAGKVVEKKVHEDFPRNRTIFREQYTYSREGDCTATTSYVHNQPCVTQRAFDSIHRLLYTIDPEGKKTEYTYEKEQLKSGIHVEKISEKLPSGLEAIEYRDSRGTLLKTCKKQGDLVLEQERYFYDFRGNLIERRRKALARSGAYQFSKTAYQYDVMDRVEACQEFPGSGQRRNFYYTYTPTGQLHQTYKPDGVVLTSEYDFEDRLVRISASDGSVDYEYAYDLYGRPALCKNHITGMATNRCYDEQGHLDRETFENGLSLSFRRDVFGRKEEIQFPDASAIVYEYDPISLYAVHRYDKYQQRTFSHKCLQYDLAGNILREQSAFDTFYEYDSLGRLRKKSQDHFQQNIVEREESGEISLLDTTIFGESIRQAFSYDLLGLPLQESGSISVDYSDQVRYPFWNSAKVKERGEEWGNEKRIQFLYDENGNVNSEILGNTTIMYTYDALDRLISYTVYGVFKIEYVYDGYHRRVAMRVYSSEEGRWKWDYETQFLYDGEYEIGRYQNDRMVEMRIIRERSSKKIPSMLYVELFDEVYYPLQDCFGNTVGILSEDLSSLVEHSHFTLFGQETNFLGTPLLNPWRFASSRVDLQSGKIYCDRQIYAPGQGLWITRGPDRFYRAQNPKADRVIKRPCIEIAPRLHSTKKM
ncbi:MAG: hypothetical protein AAGF04_01770 [Chlamydiota bacterium]